jgi:hypothetical protein
VIGVPSRLRLTRNAVAFARVIPTGSGRVHLWITEVELLKMFKNGQFLDDPVRII